MRIKFFDSILDFLGSLGARSHRFFSEVYGIAKLVTASLRWTGLYLTGRKSKLVREAFAKQLVLMGNDSFGIVALVAASIGAVLALQAAYQLRQFGAILYTGSLVSLSVTRELGPVVTAVVISGRIGARITAELGTMKVQEELDALTTMGIPVIPFLAIPRLLALAIMLPCLTALADIIGMFGGYLVGTLSLGISSGLYIIKSFDMLVMKDVLTGIIKSFVFAVLIGFISIHKGFSVDEGAEGVGKATTASVVLSIIAIIVADCLFTAIFYYLFP
ncbi:MAG TPA: ABC transporter permease [Candidatus Omnitrophota bacterium]|nr:ABC transporter permease [Candidatus Omnitrophota bacterium]